MSHSIDTPTQSSPSSSTGGNSTSDVAKDQARSVGQGAAQAGSQVASTAADQAKQVTAETKAQAQDLLAQGRSQLEDQARTGQQRASEGLSDIAGQLHSMVQGGQAPSGPAADLVRQAGEKAEQLSGWLADREPGDLLAEVRAYARRKPGMFLLGAAAAGIVAGRLTSGIVAAHKDDSSTGGAQLTGGQRTALDAGSPRGGLHHASANYAEDTAVAGYPGEYATPAPGTVPPPPYGELATESGLVAGAPAGWTDPTRTSGEGRL